MHFVIVCPVGDEPANLWKFNYEDYGYIQFIAVSIETKTIKHLGFLGRSWLIKPFGAHPIAAARWNPKMSSGESDESDVGNKDGVVSGLGFTPKKEGK